MPDNPYRPEPEQPDVDLELARLAERGERKLAAAARRHAPAQTADEAAARKRETYVRQSLGAYHGTPARKLSHASFALAAIALAVGFLASGRFGTGVLVTGIVLAVVGFVGGLVFAAVKALATPATMAAERQWLASLPFALDRYPDILGDDAALTCVLVVEIEWDRAAAKPPPEPATVHGVAGLWDHGARVQPGPGGAVELRSSKLTIGYWDSGLVETVDNFANISPNGRIPKAVHQLVDNVLLPLHRSHAIARVALARDEVRVDRS